MTSESVLRDRTRNVFAIEFRRLLGSFSRAFYRLGNFENKRVEYFDFRNTLHPCSARRATRRDALPGKALEPTRELGAVGEPVSLGKPTSYRCPGGTGGTLRNKGCGIFLVLIFDGKIAAQSFSFHLTVARKDLRKTEHFKFSQRNLYELFNFGQK